MQFGYEIGFACSVYGFIGICSDRGCTADDLFADDGLMLFFEQIFMKFYNPGGKVE